jgi:HK97 family phage portal protein
MILDAIFGTEERGSRFRPVTGAGIDSDATLKRVFGGGTDTVAGVKVDEESCMGLSGVYAAVRLLSWTIGSLPLPEYERTGNENRERVAGSKVAELLNSNANPEMTGNIARETLQYFALQWGRGLAYIERDNASQPVGLWPLHTSQVRLSRNLQKQTIYDISGTFDGYMDLAPPPTNQAIQQSWDMVDIPNLNGRSVISYARESCGEALAAQELGAGFYAGGSLYAMAITHPGKLSPDAAVNLRSRMRDTHGRQRRLAVLDEGMGLEKYGMPLKDAQFLESRQFYITEIARWYGIPPHKLRDLVNAHFNNITEQRLEFHEDLLPWLIRHEGEYNRKLVARGLQDKFFVEHLVEGILRGDIEKRYNAYEVAIRNGWMNRNEARRRENMNSIGPAGDVYTVQSQNVSLETLLLPPPEPEPTAPPEPHVDEQQDDVTDESQTDRSVDERLRGAARAAVLEAAKHAIDKEATEIRRAVATEKNFVDTIDKFYRNYLGKMEAILKPARHVCAAAGVEIDAEAIAFRHCERSREAFLELAGDVTACELVERVKTELDARRTDLPAAILLEVFGDE